MLLAIMEAVCEINSELNIIYHNSHIFNSIIIKSETYSLSWIIPVFPLKYFAVLCTYYQQSENSTWITVSF